MFTFKRAKNRYFQLFPAYVRGKTPRFLLRPGVYFDSDTGTPSVAAFFPPIYFFALDFLLDFALDFLALDFMALDFFALDFFPLDFFGLDFIALDFFGLDFFALDAGFAMVSVY